MKSRSVLTNLSRRERQIMDIVYSQRSATAAEIRESLPDPPSYSTVRALLRVLEEKGHLRHEQEGPRYVFYPTAKRKDVRRSALRHLRDTLFDGSTEQAVAALLDLSEPGLSESEFDRLAELVEQARKEGR